MINQSFAQKPENRTEGHWRWELMEANCFRAAAWDKKAETETMKGVEVKNIVYDRYLFKKIF